MILEGKTVRLVPMCREHVDALAEAGLHPELWRLQIQTIATIDDMREYVETALEEAARGRAMPFVIVLEDGRIVGTTRFADIEPKHRRVEIGWTWLTPACQRTAVNTECKYLLLRYAFEVLGCARVALKTDALNAQSRAAILRIGATEEGTLRRHMVADTGRVRDTVYFSILEDEWPRVKAELERKLQAAVA